MGDAHAFAGFDGWVSARKGGAPRGLSQPCPDMAVLAAAPAQRAAHTNALHSSAAARALSDAANRPCDTFIPPGSPDDRSTAVTGHHRPDQTLGRAERAEMSDSAHTANGTPGGLGSVAPTTHPERTCFCCGSWATKVML